MQEQETDASATRVDPLQYTHLEKLYGHLPKLVAALPQIFGLTDQEYRSVRATYDERARTGAADLLRESGTEEAVATIPWAPGERVLAVGDSITDDLQSWAEIMRHLLDLVRPHDRIDVVNGGLSAHTSAMVLRRWPATVATVRPNHVICALGGNDVTRLGKNSTKTVVGLSETVHNLREMRSLAPSVRSWTWLTPVPVVEERVASFPGFVFGSSSWSNSDIVALANAMHEFTDPVVDLVSHFGVPASPHLQGADGVHPTLAGQQAIVRVLLNALTTTATWRA